MAARFPNEVEPHQPAVAIWRTGTMDAVRAADPAKPAQGKYDDLVHGCVAYPIASTIEGAVAPERQPRPQ